VGPRAGLESAEIVASPPGFNARNIQPVASGYTVYATRPLKYVGVLTIYLLT